MARMRYNPKKMQAALLFFCDMVRNGSLGRTKLAKLLYFLDFDHFEQHGIPVTGADYVHMPRGPYPKQMQMELRRMSGLVQEVKEQSGPYTQYRYSIMPGIEPSLDGFRPTELKLLFDIVKKWENQTAAELVAASHGEAPWVATAEGETIPYEYAYYRRKFESMPDDEEEETTPLITTG